MDRKVDAQYSLHQQGTLTTLCFFACLLLAFAEYAAGQSVGITLDLGRYPNTKSVNDVIEKWDQDQHLYVKGDLGVGSKQYEQLEAWLDENAPHWTVVLTRNAQGESYRSLDRRNFQGMDAVEYALGRGLALRTNFSDLKDPRTGETDGAVFVLFLDERKFSYYASVAQDVRSLGESHWVGELDRPAFRAMRGGGRILDAVKDTITNINARLSKKISAEQEQAERAALAVQRALVNLRTDIEALQQSITNADEKAAAMRSVLPEATGELVSPPTEDWRRALGEIQDMLAKDTISQSKDQFNDVSHKVEGYLNAYAEYETFDDAVAPIESDINKLKSNKLAVAGPMATEADQHITQARESRAKGDRGLNGWLTKARDSVTKGFDAIQAEQARVARDEARRRLIRNTILATAGILAVAFVALLAWLNRRRAPAMKRAAETLAAREKSVGEEMEKVYELFDRSGEILGDKESVRKRGYEGTTRKLTHNAFEDVDDLFVMSSEVDRVMDEARDMISPKNIGGKITNLISSSKYEQGMNRMSGEPLEFHRDKGGLPLVIQRESERTGKEPPEKVTLTFDKVFAAFRERTTTAELTLNTIENSLLQVDDNLESLQQQIENASSIDRELSDAADEDGFFEMPTLFEQLIPSAQADYDEADNIAALDPVKAMQEQIPRGTRKMVDALTLLDSVKHARTEVFPKLNEIAPQLQELEYNTNWIQQRVRHLGEDANGLLETAVERSVRPEVVQFGEAVVGLGQQLEKTIELARELKHNAAPDIEDLESRIAAARNEISQKLGLATEDCLKEYEANPDLNLADARKQLASAQASLQHGGVDSAADAQDTLHQQIETGKNLIDESLRILHEFDRTHGTRQQQLDLVEQKVTPHEALLKELEQDFATTALTLQAADPTYEDPTVTVYTHLDSTREALSDCRDFIQQALGKHRQGQLLEAENLLRLADQYSQRADSMLSEIDSHCTKLKAALAANEGKLAAMLRNVEGLQSKAEDRRTMRPTIKIYQGVLREIEVAHREIRNTTPRDPFQDGRAIDGFSENISNLAAKIDADHECHAEAARAVAGAKQERASAEQLINQARHDGIPDSPETKTGIREIQEHDGELSRVERELSGEHNDWQEVNQAAARIHAELGVKAGRLRGELQRAQQLMDVFQTASDSVFQATRWTGGFGTRIFGSPGSKELERARRALNAGDYSVMAELARAAQIAAQHAIQRAQREVQRKQREQARREEAARRKRRRSSLQIGGGRSSGTSFPSGGSSSGRSSGSSSSSGSGFSRSGW